jgi:NlpC/P60 family protein/SH3 domain-containing protein
LHSPSLGARAFIPALLAGVVLIGLAPATPAAAAEPTTEAQQIIAIARQQLGDPWRYGATGPSAFDCSGLVLYAYRAAGDGGAVGDGRYRSAAAIYSWFKGRGLASRTNPKPGDLVVWGGGSHIGIYIGDGKAISTLTSGVRIHGVFAVTASFTAYLHTGMSGRSTSGATVATTTSSATTTRVTTTRVNLRTGHSTAAARITVVPSGRTVTVLRRWNDGHGHTWLNVRTGGRTGWLAGWLTR